MPRPVAQGNRTDTIVLAICVALALLLMALRQEDRARASALIRESVGAPLVSLQLRSQRSRVALLAHDSTTRIIDSLAIAALSAEPLRQENEQLRRILGLTRRLGVAFVPAEIVGMQGPGSSRAVLLSAGSSAGVEERQPVIAPQGLVGRIRTVDATTSEAILLSHPDFRASAMTADGRVFGMVRPYLEADVSADDEANAFLLQLDWVPFRDSLPIGTQVVTSGIGATFPVGIPIGTVVGELQGEGAGFQRTYLLRPNVSPSQTRLVLVIRREERPEGLLGVWQIATSLDSARAGVTAGIDSIASDSAAQVRAFLAARDAARRADSLRADSAARAAAAAAASSTPSPATPSAPPPSPPPSATPSASPTTTGGAAGAAARPSPPAPRPAGQQPPAGTTTTAPRRVVLPGARLDSIRRAGARPATAGTTVRTPARDTARPPRPAPRDSGSPPPPPPVPR